MRAVVKNGVGVFTPQGFLDTNSSSSFLSLDDIEATVALDVDIILVSLKRVVFFNKNGLDVFVNLFSKVRQKNLTTVGFCDYDEKKYRAIQIFYQDDIHFSLFKTLEIAYLFSSSFQNQNKNILLYSDDSSQRTAMAIELYDNGHNPTVAQTQKDFKERASIKKAFDAVVDLTYLGQMGQKIATRVTGNAIIYTISSFLDVEISNRFDIRYHNNSLNVGFRLFIFDACQVISMNIHALNFFSKLASAAAEYNATICFVGMSFKKTTQTFKETLEDAGILFYEHMDDILKNRDLLKELGASSAANRKNKRSINKQTVAELPRFIDATATTIEMMTNTKAIKESAEIKAITIEDKEDKIASSIGYYGDIDGMIILVFPKRIAKKACQLLIGDSPDDDEMILDTLAELVNIVGGKIKTLLLDRNIHIDITLPRTYNDADALLEVVEDRKGVQVELSFNDDRFIFFLTR